MNPPLQEPVLSESSAQALADIQFDLYAHIVALLGRADEARDVLQETNVQILCELRHRNDIRNFLAWAKTLAYYQVLKWRKKQSRDRLVLDDALVEAVGERLREQPPEAYDRLEALDACLGKLTPLQRARVEDRYQRGLRVNAIARRSRCSPFAMAAFLYRIREQLLICIEQLLAKREARS